MGAITAHLYEDGSWPDSDSEENLLMQDSEVRSLRRQKGMELISKWRVCVADRPPHGPQDPCLLVFMPL